MKCVLITGGAGFIGTHLAERLRGQCELVLFDNFKRNALRMTPELTRQPGVRIVQGDVLDAAALRQAMSGCDTVIHLAAIAGVSSYYAEPLRTLQVNIVGTLNALEAAAGGTERFVYFSSSEVFGSEALWVEEDSTHRLGPVSDPRWVYATSKLAGEHLSLRFAERHGMACAIVRPFNIYGPRQVGEGAVSNFCQAAVSGRPMTVYGDGMSLRAWCYISDLIDAVEALLRTPSAFGHAYNIGNPHGVETTLGLTERIARLGHPVPVQFQTVERSDVRARIPVIGRAHHAFGFEPRVGLDEGLTRTLDWFAHEANGR